MSNQFIQLKDKRTGALQFPKSLLIGMDTDNVLAVSWGAVNLDYTAIEDCIAMIVSNDWGTYTGALRTRIDGVELLQLSGDSGPENHYVATILLKKGQTIHLSNGGNNLCGYKIFGLKYI